MKKKIFHLKSNKNMNEIQILGLNEMTFKAKLFIVKDNVDENSEIESKCKIQIFIDICAFFKFY